MNPRIWFDGLTLALLITSSILMLDAWHGAATYGQFTIHVGNEEGLEWFLFLATILAMCGQAVLFYNRAREART